MQDTGDRARRGATEDAGAAGPEPEGVEEVLTWIRDRELRFAELWFTELSGRARRVAIIAEQVHRPLFRNGCTLDGPSTGRADEGLFRLFPDPSAAYVDPVAAIPTAAILGEVEEPGGQALDPRRVLARAEAHLRRTGVASALVTGAEPELFLLEPDGTAAGEEVVWNHLRRMASALGDAGIQVDAYRTGPSAGQGRVQMRACPAGRLADRVMLYRHIARHTAQAGGRAVSFLPTPIAGAAGGMPVHHALWKDGDNLFHDGDGWQRTSQLGRWYAGGLLAHAPALMALCAPTTNSYRRLVPGTTAPTRAVLSATSASATCRVPARSGAPGARRIKFRSADAAANPYLVFAATLMAGLDGIERRIDPPCDADPGRQLPRSLEEALAALERDHEFLLRGEVFTGELIRAWTDDRRRHQVRPVQAEPHPAERRLEDLS